MDIATTTYGLGGFDPTKADNNVISSGTVTLSLTDSNDDDLRAKGLAYLALAAPTQAQTTKAVRALVMLQLRALDNVTGT